MVVGGKFVLKAIGVELLVQLPFQCGNGIGKPHICLTETRIEHADMGQAVHLHDEPVGACSFIFQASGMLINRLVPVEDKIVSKIRAVDEGMQNVRPVGTHSYTTLDGPPAVGLVAYGTLRWHRTLVEPGSHNVHSDFGYFLIFGELILVSHHLDVVVAGELPGPLPVAIGCGIAVPVDVTG